MIVRLTATILTALFNRFKNLFTWGPGHKNNLISGAGPGLNFFIDIRYAHSRF
jgi:hypothetical protein